MLEAIGWLVCGAILCYGALVIFMITVDTFSEGLFSKGPFHKLAGTGMWGVWAFMVYTWLDAFPK